MFSVSPEVAHQFLWNVHWEVEKGNAPLPGVPTSAFSENSEDVLLPLARNNYREYLGWTVWFYRGVDFPCHQFVWPDRNGFFPWQEAFEERFRALQPDLTAGGWAGMARDL